MTMHNLPLWSHSQPSTEPFSRQTAAKASRLRGATVTESVCPYCAVGCGQLIFTKGGKTDRVWFYKMESDGFGLDDKREKIGDGTGDLPDIREKWLAREKAKKNDRKAKHFFVPVKEIQGNQATVTFTSPNPQVKPGMTAQVRVNLQRQDAR